MKITTKRHRAFHRGLRVRAKIHGSSVVPRLSVFRSLKHFSAQLIDDDANRTLLAVTEKELKDKKGTKTEHAHQLGQLLGQKAKAKGISHVVYDRGSSRYHGRIAAFAEGVRAQGIIF